MPVQRRFDFQLDSKGFMLARDDFKGRAWKRTGNPDTPGGRSAADAAYGAVDDMLDHPEVWEDWSGGFGHAYRHNGQNTYHWSEGFDARFPKQLVHAQIPQLGSSHIASLLAINWITDNPMIFPSSQEGGGNLFVQGIGNLAVISPTATGAALIYSASAGLTNYRFRPAVYGSYVYVGSDIGSFFYRLDSSGSPTTGSAPGYVFCVAGNQLWRSHGPSPDKSFYLQNVSNPAGVMTLGNWSATYNLGNYAMGIKDMVSQEDQLFAGIGDGLYAGDSSGSFVNVMSDLSTQVHPDNFRDLTLYQGAVVVQHISGVYAYRDGQVTNISPLKLKPFEQRLESPREVMPGPGPIRGTYPLAPSDGTSRGPLVGRIRAVKGYGPWLYAGHYTGSQSWLLAGQRSGEEVIWHTLQRFPHQTKISRIHVDGVTTSSTGTRIPNRIWISTDASIDTLGTSPVYFWQIPTMDGNPLMPSPAFSPNYMGSARMDLGSVDWGAPTTPKAYRSVEVWADSLLSGYRYGDIYYDVDQTGSFTLLGRANDSPKSTLYFPYNASSVPVAPNGGFETAGAGGADVFGTWAENTSGAATIVDETTLFRSGAHAARLTSVVGDGCSINQVFPTVPGTEYEISFWTRGDGTVGGRWDLTDIHDSTPLVASATETGISGTSYAEVTFRFIAPPGCTAVSFNLRGPNTTTGGTCYYDDVAFGTTFISGQSIELSLRSFTASPALTPVYRAIVLRGALRPNSIDEINAVIRIGDEVRDRQGAVMRTGAVMLQELRAMSKQSSPIQLIDISGAVHYVNVIPPVTEQETYQLGEENPEIAAGVRMAVMVFS